MTGVARRPAGDRSAGGALLSAQNAVAGPAAAAARTGSIHADKRLSVRDETSQVGIGLAEPDPAAGYFW